MNLFNFNNLKKENSVFLNQINDTIIKEDEKDNQKFYYLINTKTSNTIGRNENFKSYDIINNCYIVLMKKAPEFEIDSRISKKDVDLLKKTVFSKIYNDKNILYDTETESIILKFNERFPDISNLTFQTFDGLYHSYTEINNQLDEYIFDDMKSINKQYHIVKKDNKYGLFDSNVGIVLPIEYQNITFETVGKTTICFASLNQKVSCFTLAKTISKLFELKDIKLEEIHAFLDKNKVLKFKVRGQEIEFDENTWNFKNEVPTNRLNDWLIKDIKKIMIDENQNYKILHKGNIYIFVKGRWIKEEILEVK